MAKWSKEKILNELKLLMEKDNIFPTAQFLQKNGRWDLFRAIGRFGGFCYFRNLFNCGITPRGFWKQNYQTEIKKMVDDLGRFPTFKEIKAKSSGLSDFLFRTGLLEDLRKQYKYEPQIKPPRYWYDFSNLKNWLLVNFGELIEIGIFPTTNMIVAIKGGRCVANDVIRRHGGFLKVAQAMNCRLTKSIIAPDGHCLDSKMELIVDWYLWSRSIQHDVHGLIDVSRRYKYDFKLTNNNKEYYVEVWGGVGFANHQNQYEENRRKKELLYKYLEYNLISIERTLFRQSFPEIDKSLDHIFASNGFCVLRDKNKIDIGNCIPKGMYYWTFDNTLQELKSVVESIKKFPTVAYLRSIGKYQIQKSMQKYGGQNVFREKLKFPLLKSARR